MKIQLLKYQSTTLEAVESLECNLGCSLPSDYKIFIQEFNGSTLSDNAYDGDPSVSIDRFLKIEEIIDTQKGVDGFPENGILIAECPSGDFVYINKEDNRLFFWDHEIEDDTHLANSFGDFINRIEPFDFSQFNLEPGDVVSGWVDPNFTPKWD